ncbi:unnamed protein product [Prunus brigantina]
MGSKTQSLPFFLATLFFLVQAVAPNGTVKAGYWSSGIPFPAAAIESTLFTHLFCVFADVLIPKPTKSSFPLKTNPNLPIWQFHNHRSTKKPISQNHFINRRK